MTQPGFIRLYPALSLNSLRSIAHGSASIWEDIINERFCWTKPDKPLVPTTSCQFRQKCTAARMIVLNELLTKIGKQDTGIALDSSQKGPHHEFCAECLRVVQLASDIGRIYIWKNLGRYFLGDNWDKLEDTKYEVWPSTWQPR